MKDFPGKKRREGDQDIGGNFPHAIPSSTLSRLSFSGPELFRPNKVNISFHLINGGDYRFATDRAKRSGSCAMLKMRLEMVPLEILGHARHNPRPEIGEHVADGFGLGKRRDHWICTEAICKCSKLFAPMLTKRYPKFVIEWISDSEV